MSKLELLLLGHFECLLPSGEPVTLSMRKAEMLLAYLALAPGIRHPRERLINLLWSDRGEEQARNSLRQCLSAIKKSLGDVADLVLQIDRTSVCLKPEMIEIDALEFERLATLARFEPLSDAAALYRGEFLEGISIRDAASQEWLDSERSRFKRQYIEILTNLGHTLLASHDYSGTIKTAERLVAEDALGESGWRLLMRAYSANGDRSHALQAYKRCQQALRSELEVEPETATLELREQIAASQLPPAQVPVDEITAASTETAAPAVIDHRETPGVASQATSHSIAILPFDNLSGDPEQEYFSDGITDSIILNLSLFPDLQVKSRHSSFAFKQQIKSPGEISAELDVDYLVEGSIRKSSDRIRITVQLIEAASGTQVWGKRYDADLENLFDLEEELSRTIAATVTGQIESDLRRIAIGKSAEDQQSYDLLLAGKYHAYRFNRQDNLIAIDKLNQCIQQDPDNVHAHTQLGACHSMDYIDRWTLDYRKSFELAKWHIEKAMALNPELEQVRSNYAEFLVFAGDLDEAGRQIDKVLQINPNNPETLAVKAVILIVQEDFEGGLQTAERVLQLDPYHPWAEWELAGAQYWSGRYEAALDTISAMRTDPGFTYLYAAASHAKLGHEETARKLLQDFLRGCEESMLSMPRTREEWLDYCQSGYRFKDLKWHQDMVDCLVEVGLLDAEAPSTGPTPADSHNIAVLPFDNLSGDPAQEYFSDGISESIILHLNLFPGLAVKSRNSSFAFKQQIKSLGEISQELDVDYIVEGSIRRSAEQIRITVQLVEAASGNQVWGKRYDAPLDDLFSLEEELSRSIAATVTGQIESELQRVAIAKGAAQRESYDLLLAGTYHLYRFNREDNAIAIEKLNQCLAQDPDNVRAHVHLGTCHLMNYLERWTDDLPRAAQLIETHTSRAMELNPGLVLVLSRYAEHLFFEGEIDDAEKYLEQALTINPIDPDALVIKAVMHITRGNFEAALQISTRVCELDPYHPWAGWELAASQYFSASYEAALETIKAAGTSPGFESIFAIAANIKLGRTDRASKLLQTFLQHCQDNMRSMPVTLEDWYDYTRDYYPCTDTSFNQDLVDSLVQAGLTDKAPNVVTATSGSHTIAVLPFDNLSGDPAQEYFSDGISESIILHLSLFPDLTVKSRNSSFAFKQQIKSLGEISTELDVDYLVEGSLRKSTEQIRITVQLIEAASGNQVWGKRYDAPLADLFSLEEELSRNIAATVTGQIESDLQRIAIAKGASDQQAYDLLLAGIYHANRSSRADIAIAIDKLNQCLALDPDNLRAHATIYQCHIMNWMDRLLEDYPASFELASKHAQKALALDPVSGEAQYTYGEYLMFCHEDIKAGPYLDRALASNPNNPTYLTAKAMHHSIQGDFEAAIKVAERACQMDPYNWWVDWNLAEAHYLCGHYQETIDSIARSKNAPGFIRIYGVAANVKLERLDVARQSLQEYLHACRESMRAMPKTLDDWLQYTVDTAPFADPEINQGIVDCLVQAGLTEAAISDAAAAVTDAHTIAVLPFDNLSGDPAQEYFSDGITESVILHLNQFPDLAVKSRHSSFAFKQQIKSLGDISKELGVAYLVEGSIRKSNDQIRVTVQLVEAASGIQVWGKRYDAPLDDLFSVEEELSRNIAATVTGQIESDLQRVALSKRAQDQQAYDLLLSGAYHNQRYTRKDTAIAINKLGQCLQKDPGNAMAHAWLYVSHLMDYLDRWTPDQKASFALGAQHIRTAMELDPKDTLVQVFHAQYNVFCGNFDEANKQLKKLLSRHPDNPTVLTTMALNLELQGEGEEALRHAERACELDPYHPWAEWEVAVSQYVAGQYERVLETIENMRTTPGFIVIFAIAANIKLHRPDPAKQALEGFLAECRDSMQSLPRSIDDWMEYCMENYPFADPQYNQDIVDCLVQAGLGTEPVTAESSEQPSILVLPFSNLSGDPEQDYFSDGITDSIIASLGAFSGPRVKSRHTSFAFKDSNKSLDEIAAELDVNYIVEGSIRKSGNQVRINVQLVESESGNQLWAKRFDSDLEDLFTLEEDLTRTIAGTISGRVGKELKSSSLQKPTQNLQSYDYLMRGLYHLEKFSRADNQFAREQFQKSIEHDARNCEAHSLLASTYMMELYENWTADRTEARRMSRHHVEKAIELEPDSALVQAFLSEQLLLDRDFERALTHAERAIELNPTLPDGYSMKGGILGCVRRYEEALENADISMQIDPYHPYTGWNAGELYRDIGQYERAIAAFRSVPFISPSLRAQTAASLAGLGKLDEARAEMKHYLKLAREQMPRFPGSEAEWRKLWSEGVPYQFEADAETLFDLLLQAGLCDEPENALDAIPSILVLPFGNLSGDPEQDYFSDGITESIIVTLSASSGLRVKSRHTTFAYRDSLLSLEQIGNKLEVQYIVEGSIRKHEEQVRITIQLSETANGDQVWGKRYDQPLADLFNLEEELVQTIVGSISGRIGHSIKVIARHKPASNPKSYDYLMRGWYHGERFTPEDNQAAQGFFTKCVELDPNNAEGHCMIAASVNVMRYENWCADHQVAGTLASQHINRALELEPDNALAHAFMSEHLLFERKYEQALFHAEQAIELEPGLPDGYGMKGFTLCLMGRIEEALPFAEKSLKMDPYHFYMGWNAGGVFRTAGDYQKAIDTYRAIPVPPPSLHAEIAACLIGLGEIAAAKTAMEEYLRQAREQLASYPTTEAAWRKLWSTSYNYRSDSEFEPLWQQLLQAGLCDGLELPFDAIPSVAVLPFQNLSSDAEQEYFSDGITASLIMGLGLFSGLKVRSQSSSFALRNSDMPSKAIAQELAADFLIEGSIRKSGSKIRIAAQLVEAESDTQVWGKQYDAELTDILDLEQELSSTIAATISGRIGHRIQQSAVRKPAGNLKSYDYLLRGLYHMGKFTAADFEIAQRHMEKSVALDPESAEAHMQLGMVHTIKRYENWTLNREHTQAKEGEHLGRALELAPDNAKVHAYYAEHLLSMREYERAEFHANKAIELNPTSADGYAVKADITGFSRRYDEALILADQCFRLDPNAVGTGWVAGEVYRNIGHYEKAITTLRSISHPPASIHSLIAASFIGLGQPQNARKEMALFHQRAREEMPDMPRTKAGWRKLYKESSQYKYEEDFEELFSALLKAGLCDEPAKDSDELPSIAVLPFENLSADPEQAFFADGITADIISTLSKFRHLRIVARHSTEIYRDEKASIAEIAQQQGVRYVLEGSVRRSGNRIRVSAELIDAQTEQNCWSERYDRDLDDLFAVQDEITREITLAMKVHLDDGEMALQRSAGTTDIKAWELILTSIDLSDTYIRQNILDARGMVKQALELDPDYSYAWVMLAWTYWQEAYSGCVSWETTLGKAENAVQHALEMNPDDAAALKQSAFNYLTRHDADKALELCRRSVELEPGNAEFQGLMAYVYTFIGTFELARVHEQKMRSLCPVMPNWYYLVQSQIEQYDGDLDRAITIVKQGIAVEPDSPLCRFYLVHLSMQRGDVAGAQKIADEIRALDAGVNGIGLVRNVSRDAAVRDSFRADLAHFDLV